MAGKIVSGGRQPWLLIPEKAPEVKLSCQLDEPSVCCSRGGGMVSWLPEAATSFLWFICIESSFPPRLVEPDTLCWWFSAYLARVKSKAATVHPLFVDFGGRLNPDEKFVLGRYGPLNFLDLCVLVGQPSFAQAPCVSCNDQSCSGY